PVLHTLSLHDALPIFGVAEPVLPGLRVVPGALVGHPAWVDPVVEGEHRPHPVRLDLADEVVVVGDGLWIAVPSARLYARPLDREDRKSTRLNSSHVKI